MKSQVFRKTRWVIYLMISASFYSCKTKTIFENLPSSKTGVSFQNKLPERNGLSILYYLYYYAGGGVATGDINNDGLPDIYFTANSKGNNKLYLNKGNFEFEDITEKAGVAGTSEWCSGVTMADINGDGLLDIYVTAITHISGLKGQNELYINNGNGSFSEKSSAYGLRLSAYSVQAAFFDYDHDGDLDCYVLNESQVPFQNIVDTSNRRRFDSLSGDRFYRNDLNTSAKKFTDVSAAVGIYQSSLGYGLGLGVADLNNDGWEDVYIGNDFHENDYYYVNNGNGTFTESGAKHFRHYSRFSMGNDVADFNNDGQLDIVTTDMLPDRESVLKTYGSDENPDIYKFKVARNGFQQQYSKNCLQINNGDGDSFSETALLSGISATDWSWSALFADFDNDGKKDLFITSGIVKRTTDLDYVKFISGAYARNVLNSSTKLDNEALSKMPDGISHSYVYKGDGRLHFTDESNAWGLEKIKGYFTGAAYADLDNDGDLDMVINSVNDKAIVYRNNAPAKNYLQINFRGDGLNTMGIGCKAYLFASGKMQYQQLMTTRGFQSSSEPRLHFGLDSSKTTDSLLVVWPDQRFQVLKNVDANQQLTIQYKEAGGVFPDSTFFPKTPELFEILEKVPADWEHKEDPFDDFNIQYLIPHAESTRGPKLAVADINGDGMQDFYVSGAKGQGGTLMIQLPDGTFRPEQAELFKKDAAAEDVDARFFDANGDKAPDLYVVSGGNEGTGKDSALLDRLYLNDGKGRFVKSSGLLPAVFENKSCVSAADADHDGDLDLFVGTLADPVAYGVPQTSHLFINDGEGHYNIADSSIISLSDIGIVTAAAFADLNKDGWEDLVVAGEWMSITLFMNQHGKFSKTEIPHSSGLWQTVYIDDADGDGNVDILAGNWGWNNKFRSGKDGPCKLYVGDFDKNGRIDQLLSYTEDGKEYPFLAKDEVERQLPLLKKHYLRYTEYAGVPMKEVFYGWIDTVKPFEAERLGSAICFGDGKGGFSIIDLPDQMQKAPVFTFQKIAGVKAGTQSYLAGGNFFDVVPYEGRYDGQALAIFDIEKNRNIIPVPQTRLSGVNGQVRDMKGIITKDKGEIIVVARNNEKLIFLKQQQR